MENLNENYYFTARPIQMTEKGRLRFVFRNNGAIPMGFSLANFAVRVRHHNEKRFKKAPVPGRLKFVTRRTQYNPGEDVILELELPQPFNSEIAQMDFKIVHYRYGESWASNEYIYNFAS